MTTAMVVTVNVMDLIVLNIQIGMVMLVMDIAIL